MSCYLINNIIQASSNMLNLVTQNNFQETPFSDAVLIIDGVQFKVHKFILCCSSTYFKALFLHHSAPDRKVFKVPGLSAAAMHGIIEFSYTGSVSVTEDNVEELLQAADQFNIIGIEQVCCKFLLEKLSSKNCVGIWQFCNICFCPELQQKAYRYLLIHFEEVVYEEEYQRLSVQELSGILNSDFLSVKQESVLWTAIRRWINYEYAERQQHLTVLLSKVRLALTSGSFISKLMHTPAVKNNAECMEIVRQARNLKTYMSMLRPSLTVCFNQAGRPRLPNTLLFAIGGNRNCCISNLIEVYDYHADHWKTVSGCGDYPHSYHGTAHRNGSIYCVGGFAQESPTNAVHRFDLATHTWHEVAPMHHHRCHVSVAVLDDCIYAVGGYNGEENLRSAEYYEPKTNQWSFIASMHERRSKSSCTVLHNMIYICGGHNWIHSLNTCEYYSRETDQWTSFPSMSIDRVGLGVIAYEDLIFAVGGRNENGTVESVEAYNPRTKTWQEMASMLTSRSSFGIAVINNKLFVVGGLKDTVQISTVEYYDMVTKLWTEACPIDAPRNSLSCCVVSGLPDVAEYVISRDKLRQLVE